MRHKALIAGILCLFIYGISYSQRKLKFATTENLSHAKCFDVTIDSLAPATRVTLPFSSIVVSDQRVDSTYAGYYYLRGVDKLSKICVGDNVQEGVSAFLNNYYITTPDSQQGSIYIQVKKFWIRNENAYLLRRGTSEFSIHLKMEFFLKKEECYYPLYKIDSMYYIRGNSEKLVSVLTRRALVNATAKLAMREATAKTIRCISLPQIDSFNNAYKNIPVLKEKKMTKGVYLTFSQFKNNTPAYTEFDIVLDNASDALFVKGKTLKDSAIIDAWGFSDGENSFIRVKSNYFLLSRAGDNFEFVCFDDLRTSTLGNGPSTLIGQDRRYNNYGGNAYTSGAASAITDLLMNSITTTTKDMYMQSLNPETGRLY